MIKPLSPIITKHIHGAAMGTCIFYLLNNHEPLVAQKNTGITACKLYCQEIAIRHMDHVIAWEFFKKNDHNPSYTDRCIKHDDLYAADLYDRLKKYRSTAKK